MNDPVSATFEVTSWEEKPFDEAVGVAILTGATVTKSFGGGVDGTSTTDRLMAYQPDNSATFVGLERTAG